MQTYVFLTVGPPVTRSTARGIRDMQVALVGGWLIRR